MKDRTLTPAYARYLIHLTRPFPNFDFFFIKPVRKRAVALLNLKNGDQVLDVGCGMGGSFPYLVQAVGVAGKVVGVEISPEVTINTRLRIVKNNWQNVSVIEASAQTVKLNGMFDGLLMFAAPDVYASQQALENILPHLKDNSRIVLFGAKTSTKNLRVFNSFLKKIVTKLSFQSTPKPDDVPWKLLIDYVEEVKVQEYFLVGCF